MRIDAVELRHLRMPLVSSFETSNWKEEEKTCIIVELHSGRESGYGECPVSAGPWYSYETTTSSWHVMKDYLIPLVLGKDFESPKNLLDSIDSLRGHNMAKASFEMAFWDLMAKTKRVSLSKLLGGTQTKVASGVSVGIQKTTAKLVEAVERFLEQGYRRIKIKIKPGQDIELVTAIREDFPDTPLMVDANGAYRPDDSETLAKLDTFDLLMIEQPFAWDDLVDHAELQKNIKTPICLDESVASLSDFKAALALKSCRILNIKPTRVGGFTTSTEIHNLCKSNGIPVWCGGLLETGIGRAHNIALASLPNFVMPNDISASSRYFKKDIVEPEFSLNNDGTITVPTRSGLGVEVAEEKLTEFTKERKVFKP